MRLRRKNVLFATALGGALAVAAGVAVRARAAASCAQSAAYGLYTSSYADAILNPPKAEDVDFFTASAGVPNIMVVLGTSATMNRLPPNGPGFLGGTLPTPGVPGCGSVGGVGAAVTGDLSVGTDGTALRNIQARSYSSPCGSAVDGTNATGKGYNAAYDYAHEASACGYWGTSSWVAPPTGKDGFDPDWYCGSTGSTTSCSSGSPNFFDSQLVFHDAIAGTPYSPSTNKSGTPGDGWSYAAVYPYEIANGGGSGKGTVATVSTFCADLAATGVITLAQASLCSSCLATNGWFYDGRNIGPVTMDGQSNVSYPSIWYTGNYLSFFPPKFLIARKVLKDTIANFSKVRSAIADFSATGAMIEQPFFPDCAHPDSSFDSRRGTYINTLDTLTFDKGQPLAEALLDIGLYYHSSTTLPWFTSPWSTRTPWTSGAAPGNNAGSYSVCFSCQTSSVILVTDGVAQPTVDGCNGATAPLPAGTPADPPGTPWALGAALGGTYAGSTATSIMPDCTTGLGGIWPPDCKQCGPKTAATPDATGFPLPGDPQVSPSPLDYKNNLSRVAWYLHNFDLRKNSEATKDCQSNGGRQTLDFYPIGFGDADRSLPNAAAAGGGKFVQASNADKMRAALSDILQVINTRSTSFSVATLSTIQSQEGHSVIVPRFDPARSSFWRGHLFRFNLSSEFVNSCTPNGTGDMDCDGTCTSVFLVDKNGSYVQEDGSGNFMANSPNAPSCSDSKCTACGIAGGSNAQPFWDAGAQLAARSWRSRTVYTTIDTSGDGMIDGSDTVWNLQTARADASSGGQLDQLIPYLNVLGTATCANLSSDLVAAGDTETATAIAADTTNRLCAQEIIRYTLGADIFNEMNNTPASATPYPPRATSTSAVDPELTPDRAWKLGDIFHSSPVVVDPPSPSDGLLCPAGLSRQCMPSLWATPILSDPTSFDRTRAGNAYDGYAKSGAYQRRNRIVLVGANDGMLHAFNGGSFCPAAGGGIASCDPRGQDPLTRGVIDTTQPPYNGYYDVGDGNELWAFIPPDQLPKLSLLVGGQHTDTHYLYVDGTPMVRDVWVDGSANALHGATPADDQKQPWEYHTVAVMPERRGGVHYFALDVTDAIPQVGLTAAPAAPKFLWIYPQPGSARVLDAGESYSDFLPTPPPIGPVRVKADGVSGAAIPRVTPSTVDSTGTVVNYHERWIAFLSGGFDPQYLRGRGVHMVDVWTGHELFDFSHPLAGSTLSASDPRWQLNYPVPAAVGMVQWGKQSKNTAAFSNDGYFDTATFGDAGGQLWVLRFNDPAALDSTSRLATNWWGGRIFQMGGVGAPQLCSNEPFFYVTANVSLTADGTYRVLAGTGDRFNLLDTYGGTCGPDNLRACVQRGCTVDERSPGGTSTSSNRLADAIQGDRTASIFETACGAPAFAPESLASYGSCSAVASARIAISSCPSVVSGTATSSTKDVQLACAQATQNGITGYGCSAPTGAGPGAAMQLAEGANSITQINKYFSVRVFETLGARALFSTQAGAVAYDSARLTESNLVSIDGASTSPTTLSGVADSGWVMSYDHTPSVTINNVAYSVSRPDERTSSPSSLAANCVFWNTSQPTLSAAATGSCFVSNCKQINRRAHYFYGADAMTGGLCLTDATGASVRSTATIALVPPPAPQYTIYVNAQGQVQVGLTSVNTEVGAKNISQGGVTDPTGVLEMLDISRGAHACRHADPNGVAPACR